MSAMRKNSCPVSLQKENKQKPYCLQQTAFFNGLERGTDPIDSSGDDTAGITGAFPGRIKTGNGFRFAGPGPQDPHRGGRTCFRSGEHRVRHGKAGKLRVHGADTGFQVIGNERREDSAQIRGCNPRTVGWTYIAKGSGFTS